MKITITISAEGLTCLEVVRAITHSRLNAEDSSPFTSGESGLFRDINGNRIGEWKTEGEEACQGSHRAPGGKNYFSFGD